jgi:hypothetical protein
MQAVAENALRQKYTHRHGPPAGAKAETGDDIHIFNILFALYVNILMI